MSTDEYECKHENADEQQYDFNTTVNLTNCMHCAVHIPRIPLEDRMRDLNTDVEVMHNEQHSTILIELQEAELEEGELAEAAISCDLDATVVNDEEFLRILREYAEEEEKEMFYRELLAIQQEVQEEKEEEDQEAPDDVPFDLEEFEAMEQFLLSNIAPPA